MKRDSFAIQVSMIPDYFGEIIQIPEIQREDTVWSLEQKQLLIDSIYNDYDIPKLYLRIPEDNPAVWWLIDGQQRLTAIKEFLDNKFPLGDETSIPAEVHNKFCKDLDPINKSKIITRTIDAVKLTCTDDEEEDMFLRLNKGTPLSAAEKRNAIRGELRDAIKELSKHKFFINKINFNPKRFAIDAVSAQLTLLNLNGGPTDTKGTQLRKLYEQNRKFPDRARNHKHISGVLTKMDKVFKKEETYMKKYSVLSFFLFFNELKNNYAQKLSDTQLFGFFTSFETARQRNNRISEDNTDFDRDLYKYQTACINSPDSESSIRDRHEVLMKKFFLEYQDIEPKDFKRDFSQSQKEAIYYLHNRVCVGINNFTCPVKGEILGFSDLEYDHIKEHSVGGTSSVSNGQPLCSECHKEKTRRFNQV